MYPPGYAPPQPRPPMSGCVIALLVVLGLVVVLGVGGMMVAGLYSAGRGQSGLHVGSGVERVGLITVSGVISAGDDGVSLFGPILTGEREIVREIRAAAKDSDIKAVLLRINSPGGSAAASQVIHREVRKLRDKKPVVVSMGDVAASGGYYIASGATTIVASPATMTGSIGVITEAINYSGLAEKYGVKGETFVSGPFKDTLSPLRPMRPDERPVMQAMIADVYGQFVGDVAQARKMDLAKLKKLADGRVYTGAQAKKVGLVDQLGDFEDALELAGKLGKIKGEPKLRDLARPSSFSNLFGASTADDLSRIPGFNSRQPLLSPGLWMLLQQGQVVEAR